MNSTTYKNAADKYESIVGRDSTYQNLMEMYIFRKTEERWNSKKPRLSQPSGNSIHKEAFYKIPKELRIKYDIKNWKTLLGIFRNKQYHLLQKYDNNFLKTMIGVYGNDLVILLTEESMKQNNKELFEYITTVSDYYLEARYNESWNGLSNDYNDFIIINNHYDLAEKLEIDFNQDNILESIRNNQTQMLEYFLKNDKRFIEPGRCLIYCYHIEVFKVLEKYINFDLNKVCYNGDYPLTILTKEKEKKDLFKFLVKERGLIVNKKYVNKTMLEDPTMKDFLNVHMTNNLFRFFK